MAHRSPVQAYGAQSVPVTSNVHEPKPSQICPRTEFPMHWVAPHAVPRRWSRHPPEPLHVPSRSQVAAGSALQSSSGSDPSATGPHSPSMPDLFAAALHA
jgi:hypothetical protein